MQTMCNVLVVNPVPFGTSDDTVRVTHLGDLETETIFKTLGPQRGDVSWKGVYIGAAFVMGRKGSADSLEILGSFVAECMRNGECLLCVEFLCGLDEHPPPTLFGQASSEPGGMRDRVKLFYEILCPLGIHPIAVHGCTVTKCKIAYVWFALDKQIALYAHSYKRHLGEVVSAGINALTIQFVGDDDDGFEACYANMLAVLGERGIPPVPPRNFLPWVLRNVSDVQGTETYQRFLWQTRPFPTFQGAEDLRLQLVSGGYGTNSGFHCLALALNEAATKRSDYTYIIHRYNVFALRLLLASEVAHPLAFVTALRAGYTDEQLETPYDDLAANIQNAASHNKAREVLKTALVSEYNYALDPTGLAFLVCTHKFVTKSISVSVVDDQGNVTEYGVHRDKTIILYAPDKLTWCLVVQSAAGHLRSVFDKGLTNPLLFSVRKARSYGVLNA